MDAFKAFAFKESTDVEHRTGIFEGAYRAWSHFCSLRPSDFQAKPLFQLDPLNNPADHYYAHQDLPSTGINHRFVQAILSPWLGPGAKEETIQSGLVTLRTWWQQRKIGPGKNPTSAMGEKKMKQVVDMYTRHFFALAQKLILVEGEEPPQIWRSTVFGKVKAGDHETGKTSQPAQPQTFPKHYQLAGQPQQGGLPKTMNSSVLNQATQRAPSQMFPKHYQLAGQPQPGYNPKTMNTGVPQQAAQRAPSQMFPNPYQPQPGCLIPKTMNSAGVPHQAAPRAPSQMFPKHYQPVRQPQPGGLPTTLNTGVPHQPPHSYPVAVPPPRYPTSSFPRQKNSMNNFTVNVMVVNQGLAGATNASLGPQKRVLPAATPMECSQQGQPPQKKLAHTRPSMPNTTGAYFHPNNQAMTAPKPMECSQEDQPPQKKPAQTGPSIQNTTGAHFHPHNQDMTAPKPMDCSQEVQPPRKKAANTIGFTICNPPSPSLASQKEENEGCHASVLAEKSTGASTRFSDYSRLKVLPKDYRPSKSTVVIGRGNHPWRGHAGNKQLRMILQAEVQAYPHLKIKGDYITAMLQRVMEWMGKQNQGGCCFVKQDPATGRWHELSERASRTAVARAFRDALRMHRKSMKGQREQPKQELEEAFHSQLQEKISGGPHNNAIPSETPKERGPLNKRAIRREAKPDP